MTDATHSNFIIPTRAVCGIVRQTFSSVLRRRRGGLGGGVKGFSHRTPMGLPNTSTKLSVLQDEEDGSSSE